MYCLGRGRGVTFASVHIGFEQRLVNSAYSSPLLPMEAWSTLWVDNFNRKWLLNGPQKASGKWQGLAGRWVDSYDLTRSVISSGEVSDLPHYSAHSHQGLTIG